MKTELRDLIPDQLYWFCEYQGESSPESKILVKARENTHQTGEVLNVFSGKILQTAPIYTYFEAVDPDWVRVNIESIRNDMQLQAYRLGVLLELNHG
jgi:hypothetical protein